ncbi:MAG TPA: DNA-3-methyladenine glycosylase 2 family protein [Candidatus Binatia bacterium]|nr:DNA-3-methyladenine glycosylase 2 family protein [Candidatus Binatia bacterium]
MIPTSDLPFDLAHATRTLAARDRRLARVIATAPPFRLTTDQANSPYETLLRAITYQSISRAAATTIFARIRALGRDGALPTPERMLALRTPTLRRAGLSAAKIAAMKDLARKTVAGVVPTLDEARPMSDTELVERLVAVRGIGVWTVEMFLIFRLGRPDVLPVLDLGVRTGWAITYGKTELPTPRELLAFGERWRPWRTVASWYLWRACEAGQAAFRRKRARLSADQTRSSL